MGKMKATLKFKLPKDQFDYYRAINGSASLGIIHDFDSWLRSEIKYGDHSEEKFETLELCRKELFKLIQAENIDLDK
jgi:hypothetical protein